MTNEQVVAYWLERGVGYHEEARLEKEFYKEQERLFVDAVRFVRPRRSIVDVGCGFGRVTKVLAQAFPRSEVFGIDVSPDQLCEAEERCSGLRNACFYVHDLFSRERIKVGGTYDVAVCAELLMHIPDASLDHVLSRILEVAPAMVHDVDPNWRRDDVVAKHCFYHDYLAMYEKMGLDVREVVDGQHKLLVARRRR